jgi:hypothetical protein
MSTAARLYAEAARDAPNLAERHHLTRQAARISQACAREPHQAEPRSDE